MRDPDDLRQHGSPGTVFGRDLASAHERVGSLSQIVRVDRFTEDEGPARGARRIRLVNGGGLEAELHPDRALDLGRVTIGGVPIAWMSPTEITAPGFYEPEGLNWLRTWGGGLLTTCGLDAIGPPSTDDGADFGLHGRITAQPAFVTRAEASAEGVVVEGVVRQSRVFGENIVLRRRVSSPIGSDSLVFEDVITNEAFDPVPHFVLYHVQLGWPLLDDDTEVSIPSASVRPRDEIAAPGVDTHLEVGPPRPGWHEQVFHHEFDRSRDPWVQVANARLGVEFAMSFSVDTLPYLVQWKQVGQGHYALGVEPCSYHSIAGGRAAAHALGDMPMLQPGASVRYRIEFRLRRV